MTWLWLLLSGCSVNYSFTGISLDPSIKTIYIPNFVNRSGNGPPVIGQNFTERLKEYYQQNSSLKIVSSEAAADLIAEGNIVGYTVAPGNALGAPNNPALTGAAIQPGSAGTDRVAQNNLTITVEVKFTNKIDKRQNFTQQFSFNALFPATTPLTSVENGLIDRIFEQLVFDIFNKTVADW